MPVSLFERMKYKMLWFPNKKLSVAEGMTMARYALAPSVGLRSTPLGVLARVSHTLQPTCLQQPCFRCEEKAINTKSKQYVCSFMHIVFPFFVSNMYCI